MNMKSKSILHCLYGIVEFTQTNWNKPQKEEEIKYQKAVLGIKRFDGIDLEIDYENNNTPHNIMGR